MPPPPPAISSQELWFLAPERGPNDSSTCARKKGESERSFFIVHLQFVLVLASLFISTLFGDVRFRRNLALGPLFVNAHKM